MPAPTDTTVEQFLSGIPVPVQPAAIERELAAMWKPASGQTAGDATTAVTRVCLANLLVIGSAANNAWHGDTLHKLSAYYPCRMLWVQLDANDDTATLTAAVTALCHLPSPGTPQVCSELITLSTGCGGANAVPGAILPLLEPDLPVVLWWALPPDAEIELFDALCQLVDRVVVHTEPLTSPTLRTASAAPGLQLCLRPAAAGKATVIIWHAMGHWRELAAQFFDNPQLRDSLNQITTVTQRYAKPGSTQNIGVPAAMFTGWLAGQLEWKPKRRETTTAGLRATFSNSHGREVIVDLTADATDKVAPGRLMAVDIEAGEASFHLVRVLGERAEIRQTLCMTESCSVLKSLPFAERDEAAWLGAAIESQTQTRVFPRAAKFALWLLGED